MKIISLECPGCKAPLQVNSELKQATCNYCGQIFQLEEEKVNDGIPTFENERARLDAADAIAMETAEKIRSLIEPMEEVERLNKRKNELSSLLREQKEKLEKLNGSFVRKILWGFAAGVVGFGILLLQGGGIATFFISLLLGAGLVLLEFLWRKYRPVLLAGMVEKKEKTEAEMAGIDAQIKRIGQEHDLSYIPQRYRTPEIMEYFCNVLESKRVTTLQQAINLYEDELRHQEMVAMHQEQLRVQQEQLRTQQEQVATLQEMEENRKEDAKNQILGTVLSVGIGAVVGHGLSKFFRDL